MRLRTLGAVGATVISAGCGDAQAGATGPTPVEAENALAGTTDWLIPDPRRHGISGYVDDVSYAPGEIGRASCRERV